MKNEFIITKTVAKTLVFVTAFILARCGDNFITPPPEIPLQPQDRTPAWSPDGLKIAWTVARGGGEIWTMEADGSNQSKLVDGVEPSWSPEWSSLPHWPCCFMVYSLMSLLLHKMVLVRYQA
jgi:hypothetical protein